MNTILSIIVSLAMLFGGASLPAQPETATTWTLSNISLTVGDESVTLNPAASLSFALGEERAQAHFEVANGEDVLLPITGELTNDSVRFHLGGDKLYTVDIPSMEEMMDMDEEDMGAFTAVSALMGDYIRFISASQDAERAKELSNVALDVFMKATGATKEETEVVVDGKGYPGTHIQMDFTFNSAISAVEGLRTCGYEEWEQLYNHLLEVMNLVSGTEFTSYAQSAEELKDEELNFSIPVEMDIVEAEEIAYVRMNCDAEIEGDRIGMDYEVKAQGESMTMDERFVFNVDGMNMEMQMHMDMTGPADAYESLNMEMSAKSNNAFETEWMQDEVHHSQQTNSATTMEMKLSGSMKDGLENATLTSVTDSTTTVIQDGAKIHDSHNSQKMNMQQVQSITPEGDVKTDVNVEMLMGDQPLASMQTSVVKHEDEAGKRYAVELRTDVNGENIAVAFDLSCTQEAFADRLEGLTEMPITEEANSEAETSITADGMNLLADVMKLSSDESVVEMMQLLNLDALMGSGMADYDDDYGDDAQDADDELDSDYSYESNFKTVHSMEEAAAIYTGTMPEFTAPEGYELEEIDVSPDYINAYYTSGEKHFSFSIYAYSYEGVKYYTREEGALEPTQSMVEIISYDGETPNSATLYAPEGSTYFYFGNMNMEDVEAVLAGLK